MKRRNFTALAAVLAFVPLTAIAQTSKRPVLGYLVLSNPEPGFGFFKEGLRSLGYVDGKNVQIQFRSADGKPERLANLAAELASLRVDILVGVQTPAATAAKQATSQIPVVMAAVGDPVATGLVTSYARPGGNVTGMAGSTTQIAGKTLELIRELLPSAKRVAVLINPSDPFSKPFLEQLRHSAPGLMFELEPIPISQSTEYSGAFAELAKRRPDAVIVQPSLQRRIVAKLAAEHRLPAVSPNAQFPDEGGLLGYSASQAELYRESAVYVDRILKGAKPAELPVQQPSKFDLVLNLGTAKSIGISIPRSLVVRADKVIQ